MENAGLIFGAIAFGILVAYQLKKQAVLTEKWQWVPRTARPRYFWFVIVGQSLLATIVGALGIHDLLQP